MPERTDISLRGLAIGAAIILGGIAVSLGAAALFANAPVAAQPPRIEGPRLQTAAPVDLAAYRREKEERLNSRGPIEGDPAHQHIPIEQAMRVLAERNRQ